MRATTELAPDIFVVWHRSERKDTSQVKMLVGNWYCSSFCNRVRWSTVSNALVKSNIIQRTNLLLSSILPTVWVMSIRAQVVLPVALYAYWSVILLYGKYGNRKSRTIRRSTVRDKTDVTAIGRRSDGPVGGLTFRIGLMTACFHTDGTVPSFTVKLISFAKIKHSSEAQSLRIQNGMSSEPVAVFYVRQTDSHFISSVLSSNSRSGWRVSTLPLKLSLYSFSVIAAIGGYWCEIFVNIVNTAAVLKSLSFCSPAVRAAQHGPQSSSIMTRCTAKQLFLVVDDHLINFQCKLVTCCCVPRAVESISFPEQQYDQRCNKGRIFGFQNYWPLYRLFYFLIYLVSL